MLSWTLSSFTCVAATCFLAGALAAARSAAQPPGANYDEAKVPDYALPDPLRMEDGTAVTSPQQWSERRRPELVRLFEEHVYGRSPERPEATTARLIDEFEVFDGAAWCRQYDVYPVGEEGPAMQLLLYQPRSLRRPAPAFLALNFWGNHSIQDDPRIRLNPNWMRASNDRGIVDQRATDASRGLSASRWPVEKIVERGYALATIYYGDIDPDFDDGFQNGIHPYFYEDGQNEPRADEWGSIAAWAWGLSRALDFLQTLPEIDGDRVTVMGHSRLGKTALWAGAADERFAAAISNNSGCGGAALSRRQFGETVARINRSFPHWFCDNFTRYDQAVQELPVDQHQLIALMAPRPVYVASAVEDRWADPRGEYLSIYHAGPVYELFGFPTPDSAEPTAVDTPVRGVLSYHVRSGGHDVTDWDWDRYLDFADAQVRGQ